MALKLEGGGQFVPKAESEIRCDVHGIVTTWGELDAIQQLAVEEGIDTAEDLECLLALSRRSA